MFRFDRLAALATALLAPSLVPPPAAAQAGDSTTRSISQVEEIVVTARKRQESAQHVPVAVTAISGDRIDSTFYRDLQDIEGLAPNVVIDPVTAGPQGAALSIRGISFQDIEKSFDPAIGIFLDDIYIGTNSAALLNNFDVAGIEVLRGPQGTLFGKNTTGGALRVKRTRPTGELGAELSLTAGRFNRYDFKAVLNAPVIDDTLAAKVFFARFSDDSSFFNTTKRRRVDRQDLILTGVSFLATPTEAFEAQLTYDFLADRSAIGPLINASQPTDSADIPGGQLLCTQFGECDVMSNRRVTTQNFSDALRNNLHATTLRMEYDSGSGTLTSLTGWRGNNEEIAQDFDTSAIDFFSTRRKQRYDQISQELRYASTFAERLTVVAGLYYWFARYSLDQNTLFLPSAVLGLPSGSEVIQETIQVTHSAAPFLDTNFDVFDWLTLNAGLRYTYEHKKIDEFSVGAKIPGLGTVFNPGTDDFCANDGVDCSESWDELTPLAGFDIDIAQLVELPANDGLMSYFRYARGFKSGGFNGRAGSPESLGPYDPEIVEAFEIGLKSDWLDRRLRINPTLFWNEYDDKQEEIVRPDEIIGQETFVENAASAVTRGAELETTVVPVDGLTLTATFGFLDAQFSEFLADTTGDGVRESDFSELKLRRAPELSYAIFANYVRPLGPGRAITNVNWRWNDELHTTAQNFSFGRTPAVGLLDASLGYELEGVVHADWRLTAFGRNITDERYRAAALGVGNLFSFGAVNEAATWGIELAASF